VEYQIGVAATDKHDAEVAGIEADSLEEAIAIFKNDFPEDADNITTITSNNGYEQLEEQ